MRDLTTSSLTNSLVEELKWLESIGFRYYRSYGHFRRKSGDNSSFIGLDVIAPNLAYSYVAFRIGTLIPVVEALINEIVGDPARIDSTDRTIHCYTVNIGPESGNWRYSIPGTWTLFQKSDLEILSPQIVQFVRNLALPYVTEHLEPAAVRETLIDRPERSQNLYPYRQILAIDLLSNDPVLVESDISMLDERYKRYAPQPRAEFELFVSRVRQYLSALG